MSFVRLYVAINDRECHTQSHARATCVSFKNSPLLFFLFFIQNSVSAKGKIELFRIASGNEYVMLWMRDGNRVSLRPSDTRRLLWGAMGEGVLKIERAAV